MKSRISKYVVQAGIRSCVLNNSALRLSCTALSLPVSRIQLHTLPLDVVVNIIMLCGSSLATQLKVAHTLSLVHSEFASVAHLWIASVRCVNVLTMSITSVAFECSMRRMHSITSLNLSSNMQCDNVTLEFISSCCPLLTHINLRGCEKITDDGMKVLVRKCTCIKAINVSRCFKLTQVSIALLTQSLNLLTLEVSGCYRITNFDFIDDYTKWSIRAANILTTNDRDVKISACRNTTGCDNITTLDVSVLNSRLLTEVSIVHFVTKCARLTNLDISRVASMTNSAIDDITTHCVHLINLNISYCCRVNDRGVQALARCKYLENVHMHNLFKVTGPGIEAFSKKCSRLQILCFPYCSKVQDIHITALHWSNLTSLDVTQVTSVNDECVISIASHCPRLTSIQMTQCLGVTDISAFALSYCHTLTSIDMSHCSKLTDDGVVAMTLNCRRLTSLRLVECTRLTQMSLSSISKCTHLRKLDIAQCYGMNGCRVCSHSYERSESCYLPSVNATPTSTTLAFKTFFVASRVTRLHKLRFCTNLTVLNLSDIHRLTNADLVSIAKACVLITHLNVSNCTNLTDDAIVDVATHCKYIECLYLFGCRRLQGTYVDSLTRCPNLRVLQLPEHTSTQIIEIVNVKCSHLSYFFCGQNIVQCVS